MYAVKKRQTFKVCLCTKQDKVGVSTIQDVASNLETLTIIFKSWLSPHVFSPLLNPLLFSLGFVF